jgi:hypothetical protein
MSVDAGLAELTRRMQAPQGADPSASAEGHAEVSLSLQIGRLANELAQDRVRRQLMNQLVNVIDMPTLDFTIAAGAPHFPTYRATGADASPQEGLIWFVQRVSLAGLTVADVVNLHKTVSGTITAQMTAVHTFVCPPGVGAGLGVADWEPGSSGLILRPDDQLYIVSAGTVTATELTLTGQAIQVDLRMLAEYLL